MSINESGNSIYQKAPDTDQPLSDAYTLDASGLLSLQVPVTLERLCEINAALLQKRYLRTEQMTSSKRVKQFLCFQLGHKQAEVFSCLFLDNQHRLIAFEELFQGSINSASVYPREVVKRSLTLNAAAVIFAHNHPSGIAEPSNADRQITTRLKSALALVEVTVLDHIVVAGIDSVSFSERGWLQ